jgi:hypothetical protein
VRGPRMPDRTRVQVYAANRVPLALAAAGPDSRAP